jgi:hypothetical protein
MLGSSSEDLRLLLSRDHARLEALFEQVTAAFYADATGSLLAVNLAIAGDVAWPVWRHNRLILAPFIGVESAFAASSP